MIKDQLNDPLKVIKPFVRKLLFSKRLIVNLLEELGEHDNFQINTIKWKHLIVNINGLINNFVATNGTSKIE